MAAIANNQAVLGQLSQLQGPELTGIESGSNTLASGGVSKPNLSNQDAAIVQFSTGQDAQQIPETYTAQAVLASPKARHNLPAPPEFKANVQSFEPYDKEAARDLANLSVDMLRTDQAVRRHEETHARELGPYNKGGIQYQFDLGPDGMYYAKGGSVGVDLTPAETPEATIEKAAVIEKAALAVEYPSKADRKVAANARQMAREAQNLLNTEA